jgi:hypothetical protein
LKLVQYAFCIEAYPLILAFFGEATKLRCSVTIGNVHSAYGGIERRSP